MCKLVEVFKVQTWIFIVVLVTIMKNQKEKKTWVTLRMKNYFILLGAAWMFLIHCNRCWVIGGLSYTTF